MIEQIDILRPKLEVNDVAVLASELAKKFGWVASELQQVANERLSWRTACSMLINAS